MKHLRSSTWLERTAVEARQVVRAAVGGGRSAAGHSNHLNIALAL